jgi:hypothetical protein
MHNPYSRDGKWLWTGQEWVALPPAPPREPAAPGPAVRLALGLTGLILVAATLVTVVLTIVRHA